MTSWAPCNLDFPHFLLTSFTVLPCPAQGPLTASGSGLDAWAIKRNNPRRRSFGKLSDCRVQLLTPNHHSLSPLSLSIRGSGPLAASQATTKNIPEKTIGLAGTRGAYASRLTPSKAVTRAKDSFSTTSKSDKSLLHGNSEVGTYSSRGPCC
ncbi:uncharacterized protein K452DRAFT_12995 [Aplosporella prunicola CBS 121167]|uniref:Uncharacterized protein n=1 Tax=Aplosporella prunicola CBS 121167 TaxID=1176127 RepID=A0A6A6BHK0_9PEZI|nr:uncharacterized protein K452DRAFT_12995 [Aplosporella prunicola CBS 121167]KAF2142923.1 hypothetical protein K452DRAFT_12995 [Aplosporella prunicola CBS 121167]